MIIYEITATLGTDLAERYQEYMIEQHIPDLLRTGCFSNAFFTRSAKNRYRIQYHAYDQKALDKYLQNHATRLRDDFTKHFPDSVEISRENWEVLQKWKL